MGGFRVKAKGRLFSGWVAGLICLVGLISSVDPAWSAPVSEMQADFEAYKKKDADFARYKAQVDKEFLTYKAIVNDEFKKYRERILGVWAAPDMTTRKTYVAYSSDYTVKKVVDYEKGTITVSAVVPRNGDDPTALLGGHLKDLVRQTTQGAYNEDQFISGVEKQLQQKVDPSHLKQGQVKQIPMVADMVTGNLNPSESEIDASLSALMEGATTARTPASKVPDFDEVTLEVMIPETGTAVKARAYLPDVKEQAAIRGVDPALILAVMETESAFNPMARSDVPAYGLMQIVPVSAGRDASRVVLGREVLLSPSYLYDGTNNITMGAAYLYLLNDRYLSSIENPESRLYCVIAAYNTGAGNVARAFTGSISIKKAVEKINAISPQEVYEVLFRDLPNQETRAYLKRVSELMVKYQKV